MSYIQLTIGGKLRGLKYNNGAVMTMSKHMDYNDMESTYGYALIYSGLWANCYVKREEPDFNFEQVCEWVDQMSFDDLMKAKECFENTQTYRTLLEVGANAEEQTKKKQKSTGKSATK